VGFEVNSLGAPKYRLQAGEKLTAAWKTATIKLRIAETMSKVFDFIGL
jgi:hypothetical protein